MRYLRGNSDAVIVVGEFLLSYFDMCGFPRVFVPIIDRHMKKQTVISKSADRNVTASGGWNELQ